MPFKLNLAIAAISILYFFASSSPLLQRPASAPAPEVTLGATYKPAIRGDTILRTSISVLTPATVFFTLNLSTNLIALGRSDDLIMLLTLSIASPSFAWTLSFKVDQRPITVFDCVFMASLN